MEPIQVEITFDPPWSKELMSEEAKLELGLLGNIFFGCQA